MAWHEDIHFNAFAALAKAVEYRFTQFQFVPGTHIGWEFMNPVVVVQGDLLDVRCVGASVQFKKTEHIKFCRTVVWKGEEKGYLIDVVTERAFQEFMAMLENELERTAVNVKRHIQLLRDALRTKYNKTKKSGAKQTATKPDSGDKFDKLASGLAVPSADTNRVVGVETSKTLSGSGKDRDS